MTLYWVAAIAVLSQIGFSGSKILVSLYALNLGANAFTVGILFSLFSLCPTLFSIVIGRYADRTAPRLPMIVGSVVMVCAMMIPFFSPTVVALYAVVLMLGIFHQFVGISMEAAVGGIDGAGNRARNYAVITMSWSVANAVGPVITGLSIDHLGYLHCFVVLAVFIALPVAILLGLPGLLPQAGKAAGKHVHGKILDLWRHRPLRNTIMAGAIVGSAKDLFQFYMPVYGHDVGLSASAIGTVMGMVAVASFVIRALLPFLVRKYSEAQLMVAAVFLSAATYVLFPFTANAWLLSAIAFALGLGVGCVEPMMLSLMYAITPSGRVAEAIGLHKTIRHACQLAVPVLFGSVGAAFGYLVVFLSNSAMLVAGGMLLRKVDVPTSRPQRA